MRSLTAPILFILLVGWAPVQAEEAPHLTLTLQAARLSVTARAVPLQQILAEFSRLSGIQIHLEAALETQVAQEPTTAIFEALTIEEGLRRLLQNNNFIFVYSPVGLAEVRVYSEGKGGFRRPLPGGGENDPVHLSWLRGEALNNPDPAERSMAIEKLAGSGDQKLALETALGVLERERSPEVLKSALDLLLDQESVPLEPLLTLAASDREPATRLQALTLLSKHGARDTRVSEFLRTLAKSDTNEVVQKTAESLMQDLESD